MKATYHKHILTFKRASGTSRGILKTKETWYIVITEGSKQGIGECGILRGLSVDDRPDYEERLQWTCANIEKGPERLWSVLKEFPSIQFGVEMAFLSLKAQDPFVLFPSKFTQHKSSIDINGLVWMGDEVFMKEQIEQKLEAGFDCIKMKIGAISFDKEMELLRFIRKHYDASKITVRVDANGGFAFAKAKEVLQQLALLDIHSIEQPIAVGQWEEMKQLCEETPTPIALDEELIGVVDVTKKRNLLQTIRPQYIILKPSFIGGYQGSEEWIDQAEALDIGWWITSALESNIGLNAIAQWTYELQAKGPQGLGTGSLFTNNIPSPLEVKEGGLHYNNTLYWDFNTDTLCL
ncbi:o-succinylbenzoate synthase [uncultured Dokdonia sp.]|uniref:o-succinylbenzoate synthase n=1 Tax=uncultured Dokdonia sp. TaxID=575653 RepID=UPI002622B096|nr:o-succinylbenzoate synthase [uncultured Dokdonia sp.]